MNTEATKSQMPGEVTLRAMYQPTNPPRLMGYDVIDASGKLIGVLKPEVWLGELPADGTKLYTAPPPELMGYWYWDEGGLRDAPEWRMGGIKRPPADWPKNKRLNLYDGAPAQDLSAGDSQKALDALLTRIDDAFESYERFGAICEFEGQPMIYADTLTEIVTLRGEYHALFQSQNK